MDSWSFDSVGKGLISDESVSTRGKVGSVGWDIKHPFIFGSNPDEIQGFGEMGFPPMMRSSFLGPVMAAPHNAYGEENESSSMLSSSIVESSCREPGLFDLKLGRFVDHGDTHGFNSSRIATNLSSSEVFMPSKRTRMGGFGPPAPLCQVHGCNKNLSSCKDYHKRHKVCEVHSKTAKVIVNGIEQRFCQQCSRFHLLGEFDDGKRSCRRRLADHNERRRKPHVGVNSSQHGKSLPPYKGSKFKGSTSASSSSYLCHEIRPNPTPNALPHHQKYDTNQWWRRKFEDQAANDHSPSTVRTFGGTCNQHIGASNSVSWPIFHSSPMGGSEDLIFVDSASTVQGLSGLASDSWSALSLLSSHSQGASCHSPRNPISSFGFSGGSNCVNPMLVTSSQDQVCSDDGSTINLLQLSSQLERVEHQKQTLRIKYANDVSVGFMATEKTGF